jgi:hypothetical protein
MFCSYLHNMTITHSLAASYRTTPHSNTPHWTTPQRTAAHTHTICFYSLMYSFSLANPVILSLSLTHLLTHSLTTRAICRYQQAWMNPGLNGNAHSYSFTHSNTQASASHACFFSHFFGQQNTQPDMASAFRRPDSRCMSRAWHWMNLFALLNESLCFVGMVRVTSSALAVDPPSAPAWTITGRSLVTPTCQHEARKYDSVCVCDTTRGKGDSLWV